MNVKGKYAALEFSLFIVQNKCIFKSAQQLQKNACTSNEIALGLN